VLLTRRLSVVWAATIVMLTVLACSGIALAITYGQLDGNRHPNVGALVDRTGAYCSGTLVNGKNGAPVFVTAAHCDDDGKVYVSFDNNYVAERSQFPNGQEVEYPGTLIGDPQWYLRGHDIAVVVFNLGSTPPSTLPKARLPAKGSLNDLPKGQKFTAVGYGVTETGSGEGVRRYAVSSLTSTNTYYLGLSQNIHQGNSGTCNGDSGGPNFLGAGASETNINAALTNTGDAMCKSKNTVVRLDTQAARDFLGRYVALP
jgi:secreted trypsin-like serine protease